MLRKRSKAEKFEPLIPILVHIDINARFIYVLGKCQPGICGILLLLTHGIASATLIIIGEL